MRHPLSAWDKDVRHIFYALIGIGLILITAIIIGILI